ncbi:putative hemicentin-2, partial [Apostichopus japonicus]
MEALLMACSLSILCVCCASTEVKTVNVYNSVILEGCCDISHDRLWKFNTELVYSNHLLVNDTFDGIMSLFSNYSLVIDSITLDLDGFYQCICNLGQYISMQNYSLVVEVSPSLSITAAENQVRELLNIAANEPSRLVCQAVNAKPVANLTWMINDRAIPSYAGIQSIFPNPNGTFNTISSYTLTTSEVVSNVSCISKQLTSEIQRVDVTINTYVIPTISFTINGIDATNTVTVQYETMLTAVCQTIGGRPPSNITWVIDGQPSNVVTDGMVTVQTGNTFTSTSQMSIPATMSKGQITCLVSIGYPDSKVELHGIYHTYVLPSVFVTINGHRKVEVSRDRSVSVVCRSVGSRPMVNLLILTGHQGMDSEQPTVTSTNSEINDTYDTITSINFTPTKERGNVTCIVQGLPIKDVSSYATYEVIGEVANKEDNFTTTWLIVGGFFAAVIMLLLGVVIYFLKKNLSLSSFFSHSLEAEGEGYNRRLSRHTGRGSSFFDATSGELPKPPSLALPEVPTFPEVVEYSDVPEHAYYSAVTETATVGRIFHVNNMRMMLKMKMGLLYNRWMGTIGASNAVTKSVLITTISDEALQRKDIHWDDFVRRLLEMSIIEAFR